MEMKTYWVVATRYDPQLIDEWIARTSFHTIAYRLGIKITWLFSETTPANWIGYTPDKPSPGYKICQHFWKIEDEDQAALFHLTCGSSIKEVHDG